MLAHNKTMNKLKVFMKSTTYQEAYNHNKLTTHFLQTQRWFGKKSNMHEGTFLHEGSTKPQLCSTMLSINALECCEYSPVTSSVKAKQNV